MSLVTDSPVHSPSSDGFAVYLDAELDSDSSDVSPEQEAEDDEQEAEDESDSEYKRVKRQKVEEFESIEEHPRSTSDGSLEQNLEVTITKDTCTHPGVFRELCIRCGQKMEGGSGVAFGYIHKDLRLGSDEIARLRDTDLKNLLRHKKLYLVLDLDHTLLNSTRLLDITPEELYLKNQTDPLQGGLKGNLFMLNTMHMLTKLRPYVHTFLKEASKMFEMYIYTMGERSYALEMAKLLDPERVYFSSRVISQADCTQRHQKGLDVVLGQESAVLILDDTESVWQKHKDNLILMERYHFFASSCRQFGFNCKSLSELKSDESEPDGALATVLKVLQRIHSMFFDPELGDDFSGRDVRQDVLRNINLNVFNEIHRWVCESFDAIKSCGTTLTKATHSYPIVTDATFRQLFTGLVFTKNMEFVDDLMTFEELGLHLKSRGCHVANLSSIDFSANNGIGGCLRSLLRQFLMVTLDAADISILASWYSDQGNYNKPVVVIIDDMERCCGSVLSDFILMLRDLPVVLLYQLLKSWEKLTEDVIEIHDKVKELQSLLKFENGKSLKQDLTNIPKRHTSRSHLNMDKDSKVLNEKAARLMETMVRDYMQPVECIPFHEIVCFKNVDKLQSALMGDPRRRIQLDLLEFQKILLCSCCSNSSKAILPSMHDTSILYTLAQEHGDLINLHDWYQSFKSTVFQPSTKGKHKLKQSPAKKRKDTNESQNQSEASIHSRVRFCRAVTELQITGLLRMPSKRRPDYVQRVAFGL